jgi:hypothetical protein
MPFGILEILKKEKKERSSSSSSSSSSLSSSSNSDKKKGKKMDKYLKKHPDVKEIPANKDTASNILGHHDADAVV